MNRQSKVFVLVLAGHERDALAFARRRFPACEAVILPKTELRESNWRSQLRRLWQLKGQALVIFTDSLESLREPLLLKLSVVVHRCRETVVADSSGSFVVSSKAELLGLLPRTLIASLSDLMVLMCAWIGLQLFQLWLKLGREPEPRVSQLDIACLYPTQSGSDVPGGALSHITGFLSGLAMEAVSAVVFSGQPLAVAHDVHPISGSRRLHLFRETSALSYNLPFILAARKLLTKRRARMLYQRHGRFVVAGAVLSRLLRVPLVLEYNGSEDWIAEHWDPSRFRSWLRLCEAFSLAAASLIVVVSETLREELLSRGIPSERILVNPNAVDPETFRPRCGGEQLRCQIGFGPVDVVVGFLGTFSYWHGIPVLQEAIHQLLEPPHPAGQLRFLLVGEGPLRGELRQSCAEYERAGEVVLAGPVLHDQVPAHLDASDILVSPHVPMLDGKPFFGSPTKLFEYMAMGKAIVASDLGQIGCVLRHRETAWLVPPGDSRQLVTA